MACPSARMGAAGGLSEGPAWSPAVWGHLGMHRAVEVGQRGQSYLGHKGPSWRCQGGHVPVVVLLAVVGRLQGLFGAW